MTILPLGQLGPLCGRPQPPDRAFCGFLVTTGLSGLNVVVGLLVVVFVVVLTVVLLVVVEVLTVVVLMVVNVGIVGMGLFFKGGK